MKIAFSGIAGSGKTTLVNWASKEFNLPIVKEMAKDMIEEEYKLKDIWNNIDFFFKFQEDVMNRKRQAEDSLKSFVADRPLFDCITFMKLRLARQRGNDEYNEMKFNEIKDNCLKDWFNPEDTFLDGKKRIYDVVFYVSPFTENIENDGKRNDNKFYLEIFDTVLREETREYMKLGYIKKLVRIYTPDLEQRKRCIKDSLEELK